MKLGRVARIASGEIAFVLSVAQFGKRGTNQHRWEYLLLTKKLIVKLTMVNRR